MVPADPRSEEEQAVGQATGAKRAGPPLYECGYWLSRVQSSGEQVYPAILQEYFCKDRGNL